MPIKSILLHLGSSLHMEGLLTHTLALAQKHGACVDVVYTTLPLHVPAHMMGGRGGTGGYLSDRMAKARELASTVRTQVASHFAPLNWTWEVCDGDHAAVLASRASLADLVIVPQAHPDTPEEWVQVQKPEDLVLSEPVPALVVPWGVTHASLLDHVAIAWNGAVEVSRAVRGALPLLSTAKSVNLVNIGGEAEAIAKAEKMIVYLDRHGITAHVHVRQSHGPAGAAILREADTLNSNLLICGTHGGGALHAAVFGSTTRFLLENAGLPLLLSH